MNVLKTKRYILIIFLSGLMHCPAISAEKSGNKESRDDWPTFMHDVQRTGVSALRLSFPLIQNWAIKLPEPDPAWSESPAKQDAAHKYMNLKPRQNFDRCSDVVIVDTKVYFGSSVDGTVTCVDNAKGGKEIWRFETEGPVRFAPSVTMGRIYFGSDDGYAYCLNAKNGAIAWKERVGPTHDMIWGNEHMISVWPVRTSLLVDKGEVYWTAGLFSKEGMYLCKRNAMDGSKIWTVTPEKPSQGYLLADKDQIYVPTGKTQPRIYTRKNGTLKGMIGGSRQGGSWALIAPDKGRIWSGPGVSGNLQQYHLPSAKHLGNAQGAYRVIVVTDAVYYCTDTDIVKISQTDRKEIWRKGESFPCSMIWAGNHLFAGGDGKVAAFDRDGNKVWSASVKGKAYGLAAADQCLFVSTDTGHIYSFREQAAVSNKEE